MPTYKNVSLTKKDFNGKIVPPGQELCSLSYYNENEIQLLKVSDKPYYNPVILSGKYMTNTTVRIPEKDSLGVCITKYAIHFCLQKGEVVIHYNFMNNEPALQLYPGCKWNMRCFERNINDIIVQGVSKDFTLWIIIEKIP